MFFHSEALIYSATFPDCPAGPDIIPIVAGVVAGIVLIGLALLLIWKLLMIIHDRREFAKFEKEKMNAKWDTVSVAEDLGGFFAGCPLASESLGRIISLH